MVRRWRFIFLQQQIAGLLRINCLVLNILPYLWQQLVHSRRSTPTEGKHVELLMCKETFTDGVSVRGQILRTEGFSGTSLFYWYNWTRRRSLTKRSLCLEADCCSVRGIKCKDIEKMLSRVIRSPAAALRKVSKGFFLLTNVHKHRLEPYGAAQVRGPATQHLFLLSSKGHFYRKVSSRAVPPPVSSSHSSPGG